MQPQTQVVAQAVRPGSLPACIGQRCPQTLFSNSKRGLLPAVSCCHAAWCQRVLLGAAGGWVMPYLPLPQPLVANEQASDGVLGTRVCPMHSMATQQHMRLSASCSSIVRLCIL